VQLTVLLAPSSVTPAGHEDRPAHITLQAAAEHVTGALHEVEPQLTVQLDPPHATWPQLDVALQSTVQEAAAVQSTAADVCAAAVTEQGMPGGHVHPVFEHCNTQVPPLHVPAVQSPTHVALAALSIDASDPALAAPSVDPSDPARDDASGAASVEPSAAPGPPPSPP
jgi:hypothetical protein